MTIQDKINDVDIKLVKLTNRRDAAQAALFKAQEAHEVAEQKLQDFLTSTAADLTTKLQSLKLDYRIKLVKTLDRTFDSSYSVNRFNNVHIEWYYVSYGVTFIVENGIDTPLASYDTPAQVDKVIDLLKAAIARGDKEFKFPTIRRI